MKIQVQVFAPSRPVATKNGGQIIRQNYAVESATGPQVFQMRHFEESDVLAAGTYEVDVQIYSRTVPQRSNPSYSETLPFARFTNFTKVKA